MAKSVMYNRSHVWIQQTFEIAQPFHKLYQSILTWNVKSAKGVIFILYKPTTVRYFNLCFDKLIPDSKMQTFKERIDKIPESLPHSENIVDDLLMVNCYRLKVVGTYHPFYHLYLKCNET